jgi:hypothetical protein
MCRQLNVHASSHTPEPRAAGIAEDRLRSRPSSPLRALCKARGGREGEAYNLVYNLVWWCEEITAALDGSAPMLSPP